MHEIAPGVAVGPLIKGGKAVIKVTRAPVDPVLARLAQGLAYEELMAEYGPKRKECWRR